MIIRAGLSILALGAVLRLFLFGVVAGVDIHLTGYILMLAGVMVVVVGLIQLARQRRSAPHTD